MRLQFDERTSEELVYRGQVVMSARERPYLERLLSQFHGMTIRSVLEVGYGLGITAEIIQNILRPTEVHDIIEIETSIFEDLYLFSQNYSKVNAICGDAHGHGFGRTYQFLFYDPYDYGLSGSGLMDQKALEVYYQSEEIRLANAVLEVGGIMCHPFFGDLRMPELTGFRTITSGSLSVPEFPLWDGSVCEVAQIGYYVKQ